MLLMQDDCFESPGLLWFCEAGITLKLRSASNSWSYFLASKVLVVQVFPTVAGQLRVTVTILHSSLPLPSLISCILRRFLPQCPSERLKTVTSAVNST